MSEYVHKRHNVCVLLYHIVCPAKYRLAVFTDEVDAVLTSACFDISCRYEIEFIEIGTDKDHVHFLVQSVPTYSPPKIVRTIKSLTAREILQRVPSIKSVLWGGALWTSGYYVNTVSRHESETTIINYVKNQGSGSDTYHKLHTQQLDLFG